MPCRMSHASIDAQTRAEREMPEDIIRLCVGIEDVDDLIDDLKRAFVQAGALKVSIDGLVPLGPEDGDDVLDSTTTTVAEE